MMTGYVESGRVTTSEIIVTRLSGGPSFVDIVGLLLIRPEPVFVWKIISSLELSPTAIAVFSSGA